MKKKWFWTLFGGRTAYKVPNFVIHEISNSKHIKQYRLVRHDGLNVSLISFKNLEGETVNESAIFIGGRVDDDSVIHHNSLGDMFEYATKLGNGEISTFYRPDDE